MASVFPAAILNKMRPAAFNQGEALEYFRILEGLLVQIQGQVGVNSGTVNAPDQAGVIDVNAIVNTQLINDNAEAIEQNADDIADNADQILINAGAISQNTDDISDNSDAIDLNAEGIQQNDILAFSMLPLVLEEFRKISDGEFEPQFGSGSPEGVVVANYNRQYFDTSIPQHWVNPVQGANTGWVQVV